MRDYNWSVTMKRAPRQRSNEQSRLAPANSASPRDAAEHVAAIGELVRTARRGRYTLEELAERADVSSGLISQLENGQGNPSLMTILKLAYALDIPLAQFFHAPLGRRRMLVTKTDRMKLAFPGTNHHGLTYELLTPDFQRQLALMRATIPDGWDNRTRPFIRVGEEAVHVLDGDLEITVGDETFHLTEGDTLTFNSGLPHFWRNRSGRVAHVIVAETPPPT